MAIEKGEFFEIFWIIFIPCCLILTVLLVFGLALNYFEEKIDFSEDETFGEYCYQLNGIREGSDCYVGIMSEGLYTHIFSCGKYGNLYVTINKSVEIKSFPKVVTNYCTYMIVSNQKGLI
jgi:hypothetical protein